MSSFLIIGMGRFGGSVAVELHHMKHEVLAVDDHEDKLAPYIGQVTNAVIGDTTDEAVLRSLGVQNFDCVVVGIGEAIENSIWTLMILKELGAKMIVCKAWDERHAKILSQLGADRVVRPEYDMGKRIAHSLAQVNSIDFLELPPEYSAVEITVPLKWTNKSIMDNQLRRKHGLTVLSVRSAKTGKITFSPEADTVLHKDDLVTVVGKKKNVNSVVTTKAI